jgi:hypothetical protein
MTMRIQLAIFLAFAFARPSWGQSGQATPSAPSKRLSAAQVWTLDSIYTDHEHGVTFRYPSAWARGTDFAYHQPLLTVSNDAHIVASFGYHAGNFPPDDPSRPYAGTNLEGFGMVYATAAASNEAQCQAMAAAISISPKHTSVLIGKRRFSEYETSDAGMSQSIGGNLYVTFTGSTCYFFETDSGAVAAGVVDGIKDLTDRESRSIDSHLLAIMQTVRISPSKRNQ